MSWGVPRDAHHQGSLPPYARRYQQISFPLSPLFFFAVLVFLFPPFYSHGFDSALSFTIESSSESRMVDDRLLFFFSFQGGLWLRTSFDHVTSPASFLAADRV